MQVEQPVLEQHQPSSYDNSRTSAFLGERLPYRRDNAAPAELAQTLVEAGKLADHTVASIEAVHIAGDTAGEPLHTAEETLGQKEVVEVVADTGDSAYILVAPREMSEPSGYHSPHKTLPLVHSASHNSYKTLGLDQSPSRPMSPLRDAPLVHNSYKSWSPVRRSHGRWDRHGVPEEKKQLLPAFHSVDKTFFL